MWPVLVVEGRSLVQYFDQLERIAIELAPTAPALRPGDQLPSHWRLQTIGAEVDRLDGEPLTPHQRKALIRWAQRRVATHCAKLPPKVEQRYIPFPLRPPAMQRPDERSTVPTLPPPQRRMTWRERLVNRRWQRIGRDVAERRAMPPVVTPREAELHAAALMRKSGISDARVTAYSGDGGIDVTSSSVVAQVKHQARPVGRPAVQQLHGAAVAQGKAGWFYSTSGYTPQAELFARQAGVRLLTITGFR